MEIQLLRHATLLVKMNGKIFLVDPMLSGALEMPPIVNSTNERRNPLVEIICTDDLLQQIDGVILTHMHQDHFDDAAAQRLPKDKVVFCQPEDEEKLSKLGFSHVCPIIDQHCFEGIKFIRTKGQHGMGEIGIKMSPVSGYILRANDMLSLYIAGDTIYCSDVQDALETYQPAVTVVNAGAAQFSAGDPITMTAQDVAAVCKFGGTMKVVAVHMEAINHCLLSRKELHRYLKAEGLIDRVSIPKDGEVLHFNI
jgi:L-ascorbate metabolism protein UlaG (beta-lactamase superfamily)